MGSVQCGISSVWDQPSMGSAPQTHSCLSWGFSRALTFPFAVRVKAGLSEGREERSLLLLRKQQLLTLLSPGSPARVRIYLGRSGAVPAWLRPCFPRWELCPSTLCSDWHRTAACCLFSTQTRAFPLPCLFCPAVPSHLYPGAVAGSKGCCCSQW